MERSQFNIESMSLMIDLIEYHHHTKASEYSKSRLTYKLQTLTNSTLTPPPPPPKIKVWSPAVGWFIQTFLFSIPIWLYHTEAVEFSKPRLAKFWYYAKVELVPPTPGEFPAIQKGVMDIVKAAKTGKYANLTVKVCIALWLSIPEYIRISCQTPLDQEYYLVLVDDSIISWEKMQTKSKQTNKINHN